MTNWTNRNLIISGVLSLCLSGCSGETKSPENGSGTTNNPEECKLTAGGIELCDGLDNDCDGEVDETHDVGEVCLVGEGECETPGVKACADDQVSTICNLTEQPPSGCDLSTACIGEGESCEIQEGDCRSNGVIRCDGSQSFCDAVPSLFCEGECREEVWFNSTQNCGTCGNACEMGQVCDQGNCECPSNQVLCGGSCRAPEFFLSNSENCGVCSNICDTLCDEGECVGATDVALGEEHACALISTGRVYCWGSNDFDQLGYDGPGSPTPVLVEGLTDVVSINAGRNYTCALDTSAVLRCWGSNESGALGTGIGGSTSDHVPRMVASGVDSFSCGASHACVLIDGQTSCWGANVDGQLGIGNTDTQFSPMEVTGLSNVLAVSAGDDHTCVIEDLFDGIVKCWGANGFNKLGDQSNPPVEQRTSPGSVYSIANIKAVAAGDELTCMISADVAFGTSCIGMDFNQFFEFPTEITTLDIAEFSIGKTTRCFVTVSDQLYCWGEFAGGGSAQTLMQPTLNTEVPNATRVDAGSGGACAIDSEGRLYCWGRNSSGQLGDGTYVSSASAKKVEFSGSN
ncbi:MopE-related protein [Microvenator marinus]|nr:MopE-related protein [Microvenator marinus]